MDSTVQPKPRGKKQKWMKRKWNPSSLETDAPDEKCRSSRIMEITGYDRSKTERAGKTRIVGNGSLFTKLNYDIRHFIYAYIMPIMKSEKYWKGYVLSCHQAYEELTEYACPRIKKYITKRLAEGESHTRWVFKLWVPINTQPRIALLSSIVLTLEQPRLD
jgi:hypothetical protein